MALWREPAAEPSGLASSTSQSAVPRGGRSRRRRSTTATPARSLPWITPTTRIFTRARGEPTRSAWIGRPCAERPITTSPGWAGWGSIPPAASAAAAAKVVARTDTWPEYGRTVTVALAESAAAHGRVAIDTEFVSERRYQALLCLAQVAVPDPDAPDGVRTEVIDPLGDDPPDPQPLARVLADPAVEVVVHAGRQDIAILRRAWDTEVTNVFDTQLAAGFIGFGNQEGYESLVRKVLDVKLKGSEGFTKWDKRPLTPQQLEYAADDARLLLALGEEIERRLVERGRLEWAREECRALEESSDERDPDRVYERLPRLDRLNERARGVARELVEWREGVARAMDRPPGYVLPDQALIELARRAPGDRAGLEQIRGLPAQTLHRRGDELLAAIARGRERSAPPAPLEPARPRARRRPARVARPGARAPPLDGGGRGGGADRHPVRAGALVSALRRGRRRRPGARGERLAPRAGRRRAVRAGRGPGGAERRQRRRAARQPDLSPAGSTPSSIRRRMSPARRGLRETWRCPTLGFCTSRPAASSSSPSS